MQRRHLGGICRQDAGATTETLSRYFLDTTLEPVSARAESTPLLVSIHNLPPTQSNARNFVTAEHFGL
jgi:hypothetical protein